MKIALISDTHGFTPAIPPEAEVAIHAGDIAWDRNVQSSYQDHIYPWAKDLGIPVYATFGNHDFIGQRGSLPDGKPDNLHLIVDDWVIIGGKKVWFSPWSVTFGPWAFMDSEQGLKRRYAAIPTDIDVLVSHGPPWTLGDKTAMGERVGSKVLLQRMEECPQLKLVVTGHIHEARGEYEDANTGIKVINATVVDLGYRMAPVMWDFE